MRLISCHIENFGKLQDLTVEFSENPALFCQENGWGKSTLAAFLKVMFYGFTGENKRKSIENERRRYQPWQGGTYGGSLIFEINEKRYEISRVFGAKASADIFEIREADTNLRTDAYSEQIGEELFGINRESFEQTVFISQTDRGAVATDGIHARLGDLDDGDRDMDSYESAVSALTAVLNELNPNRKTGSLYKKKDQAQAMERTLTETAGLEESLAQVEQLQASDQAQLDACMQQRAALNQQQEQLSAQQDRRLEQSQYRQLRDQVEECRAAMSQADEVYASQPVEEAEVTGLISRWGQRMNSRSEMEQMAARLKTMQDDFEALVNAGQTKTPPFLLAGIVMMIVGVLLCIFFAVAFGIMWIIIGVVLLVMKKKYESMHKKPLAPEEDPDYLELDQRLKDTRSFAHETDDEVRRFLARYGKDFHMNSVTSDLQQIWTGYLGYCNRRQNLEQAEKKLEEFRAGHDVNGYTGLPEERQTSIAALQQQKQQVEERIQMLQKRIQAYEQQIGALHQQQDEREELQQEADALEQELEQGMQDYALLQKTKELLGEAHDYLAAEYTGPLLAGFSKYYQMLTGEQADTYRMDATLAVTRLEEGLQRDVDFLSEGNKDLISLCMRLAMVDTMYAGEKPFLILDDPFVNLDGEKKSSGMTLLDHLAEEYQVIYFTCTQDRMPQ